MALGEDTRTYTYKMGFKFGDDAIPDPTAFSGAWSDLDTLGERDGNGKLKRNMVASKHHTKIEYTNIDYTMMLTICSYINGKDRFKFTYPDPFAGENITITAYAGDREWESVMCNEDGRWIGTLSFSVIEI